MVERKHRSAKKIYILKFLCSIDFYLNPLIMLEMYCFFFTKKYKSIYNCTDEKWWRKNSKKLCSKIQEKDKRTGDVLATSTVDVMAQSGILHFFLRDAKDGRAGGGGHRRR